MRVHILAPPMSKVSKCTKHSCTRKLCTKAVENWAFFGVLGMLIFADLRVDKTSFCCFSLTRKFTNKTHKLNKARAHSDTLAHNTWLYNTYQHTNPSFNKHSFYQFLRTVKRNCSNQKLYIWGENTKLWTAFMTNILSTPHFYLVWGGGGRECLFLTLLQSLPK